jgi:hypothetical protein
MSNPPQSNPSTFPQGTANPSAVPPDSSSQQASNQPTTLEGCLSQSSDGGFILADASGNNYQLRGDTTHLNAYLGKQVRVEGMAIPDTGTSAGAMASSYGSSAGGTNQFSVNHVHKVADTCTIAGTR